MGETVYDPSDKEPYLVSELVRFSLGKVTVELECENANLIADRLIAEDEEKIVT